MRKEAIIKRQNERDGKDIRFFFEHFTKTQNDIMGNDLSPSDDRQTGLLINSSNAEKALGSRSAVCAGIGLRPRHEIGAGFENNVHRASCVGGNDNGACRDRLSGGGVVLKTKCHNFKTGLAFDINRCWTCYSSNTE